MSDVTNFEGLFAQRLRSYAADGAPRIDRAAVSRAVAAGVVTRTRQPRLRWFRGPSIGGRPIVAQAAAVGIILIIAVGGFAIWADNNVVVPPGQTPQPSPTPSPSAIASPSPSASERASLGVAENDSLGWPHARSNPPGDYAWDGFTCAGGRTCQVGWMHNGNRPSGHVEISILAGSGLPSYAGAIAVTIAGYPALYRRPDARHEAWLVDIEGTEVLIRLGTQPGASEAELDEAYAIIDSLRAEATDNRLGFRLVFTLTTDDWDSG